MAAVAFGDLWWEHLLAFAVGYVLGFIISPVLTFLVIIIGLGVGAIVDAAILEPVAWVLDREAVDKVIKSVSFLALIIGFHFDLLAS
jgi:hypothetical protein